jgi:hypothetical protein
VFAVPASLAVTRRDDCSGYIIRHDFSVVDLLRRNGRYNELSIIHDCEMRCTKLNGNSEPPYLSP